MSKKNRVMPDKWADVRINLHEGTNNRRECRPSRVDKKPRWTTALRYGDNMGPIVMQIYAASEEELKKMVKEMESWK